MKKIPVLYLFLLTGFVCFIACEKSSTAVSQKLNVQPADTATFRTLPLVNDSTAFRFEYRDSVRVISLGSEQAFDKLPALDYEYITPADFYAYKKLYTSPLDRDSSHAQFSDSFFILQTAREKIRFPNERHTNQLTKRGQSAAYSGFNDALKVYVIERYYVGEIIAGNTVFMDSTSGQKYRLEQLNDFFFELPVFSPSNRYMIAYVNNLYATPESCFLEVFAITRDKDGIHFRECASSMSAQVEEVVWITDESFAVRINDKVYDEQDKHWVDRFVYARTSLKK